MDPELLTINYGPGALWHIRQMPDSAVFHLNDQIISINQDHFATFNRDFFGCWSMLFGCFSLYLCIHSCGGGQETIAAATASSLRTTVRVKRGEFICALLVCG